MKELKKRDLTIKNIKNIKNINYIRNLILFNDLKNGTYLINENLEISKMDKKQMLKEGNFIYGIKKEFPTIEFINYFRERVGKQKIFLGKWKDPKNNIWIIEIVEFGNDKMEVIELANKYKQFSIWNIEKEEEIIL